MSGLIDTGEIVPYGEPATFAQRMKNRFESNALPGPINGPHLSVEHMTRREPAISDAANAGDEMRRRRKVRVQQNAPIFHVRAPCERMTDNHHIVPPFIQLPPRLVRNGHVPQGLSTFEGEGWEDENLLANLNKWRHLAASETSEGAGQQQMSGT